MLRNIGSNLTEKNIVKAGKSIATVQRVWPILCPVLWERLSNYSKNQKVFILLSVRQHDTFKLKCYIMQKLSKNKVLQKVQTNIDQLYFV